MRDEVVQRLGGLEKAGSAGSPIKGVRGAVRPADAHRTAKFGGCRCDDAVRREVEAGKVGEVKHSAPVPPVSAVPPASDGAADDIAWRGRGHGPVRGQELAYAWAAPGAALAPVGQVLEVGALRYLSLGHRKGSNVNPLPPPNTRPRQSRLPAIQVTMTKRLGDRYLFADGAAGRQVRRLVCQRRPLVRDPKCIAARACGVAREWRANIARASNVSGGAWLGLAAAQPAKGSEEAGQGGGHGQVPSTSTGSSSPGPLPKPEPGSIPSEARPEPGSSPSRRCKPGCGWSLSTAATPG